MHHYIFIVSQLWLTSHLRSTVTLLDTGTPTDHSIDVKDVSDRKIRATHRFFVKFSILLFKLYLVENQ